MKLLSKQRLARVLRRAPWVVYVGQRLYRLSQPWLTVGAVGAVFDEAGRVLLVEHVYHLQYPWGLPGGWMGRGEDPEQTVRREVREETGLHVQVLKPLVCVRSRYLPRHLDVAYLCQAPADGTPIQLSAELLTYRWYDPLDPDPPPALIEFHRRALEAALAERQMNLAASPPRTQ